MSDVCLWCLIDSFKSKIRNWKGKRFLEQQSNTNLRELNTNIMICIFWKLLEALILVIPGDVLVASEFFWFICHIF